MITLLGLLVMLANVLLAAFYSPLLQPGLPSWLFFRYLLFPALSFPVLALRPPLLLWPLSANLPLFSCHLLYSFSAGLWIYASLDAIDGKQARRTGTSGPLGQLFDHGPSSSSFMPSDSRLSIPLSARL